jgi:5-methylcytosine-specific restriction endonuclease McrA
MTYYEDHKEEIKKRSLEYFNSHLDECHARNKKWQETHPARDKARKKKWSDTHKELTANRTAKWQKDNPDRVKVYWQNRRALKCNAVGNGITLEQWQEMKAETGGRCCYCGRIKPLCIEHVEPLSKSGTHNICNIVPACKTCNSAKHNKSLLLFLYYRNLCGEDL